MKKKEGSLEKIIVPTISVVIIFIIVIIGTTAMGDVGKKDRVDMVAKNYMLKMETQGYLKSDDKTQMIKDLEKVGMKNVVFTNTTFSKVNYGESIYLGFTGNIEVTEFKMTNALKGEKHKTLIPYNISLKSTGKH